ncbi:MAG: glycosyltransferase family 4 protein [Kiritimatiellae bacterium]|nr:glycosyltransferase family 4 protein [Kiritimatiellia bacterium]
MPALRSIAVVAPRYVADGAAVGGAETLLAALARRLVRQGVRARLLTTCAVDHFSWANERPAGVVQDGELEVECFPVDPREPARYLALQRAIGQGAELSAAEEAEWLANGVRSRALLEHLRAADYERVIVGPYLFGLTEEVVRALPDRALLVPCLHDEPFARLRTIRAMFARARGCLFNSEPEMALARRLVGLDPARGRVVGMGLELFDADPAAFAAARGLSVPYLIYSGRREAAKGTPALIEYVRTFRERTGRDVRLVLTGSGAVEPAPFVVDAGVLPEPQKREAIAGAHVFVHSSRLESFGIVLLEAFLARVPALVPAGSEVLRWQCARANAGLWYRHYPDFEVALQQLLADEPLRRRLGEQGRRFVEREYSWSAVERRLWRALEEL